MNHCLKTTTNSPWPNSVNFAWQVTSWVSWMSSLGICKTWLSWWIGELWVELSCQVFYVRNGDGFGLKVRDTWTRPRLGMLISKPRSSLCREIQAYLLGLFMVHVKLVHGHLAIPFSWHDILVQIKILVLIFTFWKQMVMEGEARVG